jgi:hypothetical protein
MPTATPGLFEEQVSRIVSEIGVDEPMFLGLETFDWIILGVSLLGVLAGYTCLIRRAQPRAVARTHTELDDRLLKAAGPRIPLAGGTLSIAFGHHTADFCW